jgi:hypothetical protein
MVNHHPDSGIVIAHLESGSGYHYFRVVIDA